jgi:monoamine oxidase
MPETRVEVAAVGAGLAGLTAAYRLQQVGVDVALYEAHPERVGGRCWTERSYFAAGLTAEHGAERIDSRHRAIRDLVSELGLELYDHLAESEPAAFVMIKDRPRMEQGAASAGNIVLDALRSDMARRGISPSCNSIAR